MVMDRHALEDVLERVDEFADEARAAVEAAMPGQPLGSAPANDHDFALFFEQQARKDPDWVRALPYVDGGSEYLTRYERVRGLRGQ